MEIVNIEENPHEQDDEYLYQEQYFIENSKRGNTTLKLRPTDGHYATNYDGKVILSDKDEIEYGLTFPEVTTRVCFENHETKEVIVYLHLVFAYDNLHLDIAEAEDKLTTLEMVSFLQGQTSFLTRNLYESSRKKQRDLWSPEMLAVHIHQEVLVNRLKQETKNKLDKYIEDKEASKIKSLIPALDYLDQNCRETMRVIEELQRFIVQTQYWLYSNNEYITQISSAMLIGSLFSTLVTVAGIRYQFHNENKRGI